MTIKQPVVLCILDGFGLRDETEHNAIKQANTPHIDRIFKEYPMAAVETSGKSVGLPVGQMGNSEVGHMTIGSGRVVMQSLPRIDDAIESGALKDNAHLQTLITSLKKSGGACHLMGLLSDGGVHSHCLHIYALARVISEAGVEVKIHAFLDGRDTPPQSALGYVKDLNNVIAKIDNTSIATVSGRYYAMDRDKRWERVIKAYDTVTLGKGNLHDRNHNESAVDTVRQSYNDDVNDEFVIPTVIGDYEGMKDGDAMLFANFRADRARELSEALVDPDFDGFERNRTVQFVNATGMVEYSDHLNQFMQALFPVSILANTLGQVVSEKGLKQLRIAETEKYAHVTFFLNGGVEAVFDGEERILVPSPKVATYDLQPEMAAPEVTEKLTAAIRSKEFALMTVNYANGDMVGHTGNLAAATKAIEAVDDALGKLVAAAEETGTALVVTADHGNAEEMYDHEAHAPHTQHTLNPVPIIVINSQDDMMLTNGGLSDIAPTVLDIMGIEQPAEMTGTSLNTL